MSQIDFWAKVVGTAGRRAPGDDELTRRICRLCTLTPGARVLDLGAGTGELARLLAREYGCLVTCVDTDETALARLSTLAAEEGVANRVATMVASKPYSLSFEDASYEAVIAESGFEFLSPSSIEAIRSLRRLLCRDGKLALISRARVGRALPEQVASHYSRLNVALDLPGRKLAVFEQAGFEPLAAEALGETLVDAHFRQLEDGLGALGDEGRELADETRAEIDLRRSDSGRNAINTVLFVARRREPGEKPPMARGNG